MDSTRVHNTRVRRLINEFKKTEVNDLIINENNIFFTYKLKRYKINLPEFYPFKGPCEFYENDIRKNYYNIPLNLKDLYLKFYKFCPCCRNLLCSSIWNQQFSIIDIINEYHIFEKRLILLEKINLLQTKLNIPEDIKNTIYNFVDLKV